MIDLHCHVLPGIDDGPPTMGHSLALARASAASGTGLIVATPHVDGTYYNDSEGIAAGVAAVNGQLASEGVPLEVVAGAEVAISRALELPDDELVRLRLGSGPYLLIEAPLSPAVGDIDQMLFNLQVNGHQLVLAHPERSPLFLRRPERLAELVARDVLCSITAGSIAGRFGQTVRRFTLSMLREGLVHNVASDAHDTVRRPPGVRVELEAAERDVPGISARIEWFTAQVPAAILSGERLPPAPPLPERRPGMLARLRRR